VRRSHIVAAAVGVGVAVAVLLVSVGRWERSHHAQEQNAGITRVREAVGELDSRALAGFRFLARFQCLVYARGRNEFALELCVDREGRVVEAIDRRSGEPRFWSVREEPDLARVRVERALVERLIVRMCPTCRGIFERERAGR